MSLSFPTDQSLELQRPALSRLKLADCVSKRGPTKRIHGHERQPVLGPFEDPSAGTAMPLIQAVSTRRVVVGGTLRHESPERRLAFGHAAELVDGPHELARVAA